MTYESSITPAPKALPSRNEIRDNMLSSQIRLIHQYNRPSNRKPHIPPSVDDDMDQESTMHSGHVSLEYDFNNSYSYHQDFDSSIGESTIQSDRSRFSNRTSSLERKPSHSSSNQHWPGMMSYNMFHAPPENNLSEEIANQFAKNKTDSIRSNGPLIDHNNYNNYNNNNNSNNNYYQPMKNSESLSFISTPDSNNNDIQITTPNTETKQYAAISPTRKYHEDANRFDGVLFGPTSQKYQSESNRASRSSNNLLDPANFSNESTSSFTSSEEARRRSTIVFDLNTSGAGLELDKKKNLSSTDLYIEEEKGVNEDEETTNEKMSNKNGSSTTFKGKFKKRFGNILHHHHHSNNK